MSKNPDPSTKSVGPTFKKLATLAGVTAVASSTSTALNADIVYVNDRPVSQTIGYDSNAATWDIDGNGTTEFAMTNFPALGFSTTTYGFQFIPLNLMFQGGYFGSANQLLGTSPSQVAELRFGDVVGPTRAGYSWQSASAYQQLLGGRAYATVTSNYYSTNVTGYGGTVLGVNFQNFHMGDNVLGFRFLESGNLHYGWAQMNIEGRDVTITNWAYESTPDTPIFVDAIPEPGSLALLGIGAAGLLAWRKKRQA